MTCQKKKSIGLLLAAGAAGALATAAAVHAQQPPAATAAAQARSYDVPPGPLTDTLNRYASAAGVALTFSAAQTDGLASPGVRGTHSVAEGFARVLAGSGLEAMETGPGRYAVARRPAPLPSADGTTLAAVTVTAQAERGTVTEGRGSYAAANTRSATGLNLSLRETPQSVSVITRDTIDDFALTRLDDVIALMPGVYVSSYDSERTTYSSRGFSVENFQYDGVPTTINSAYSAGNTLSSTAIYDHVEVIKGAAGLLNGAGQPGAVLNLVRKKPTATPQKQITVGAGSWQNYLSELDVSGPLTEDGRIRGRAVAAYQDQHSFLDGNQRKTSVLYSILEADLTPDTLLTLGLDYQDTDPRRSSWSGTRPIYDRAGNRITLPRSYNSGADWSRWQQTSGSVFASLEQRLSNRWRLRSSVNRQYNGYDAPLGSIQSGPFADGTSTIYANKYVGRTKTDTIDIVADGSFTLFGREHDLILGAQASRAHWTGQDYGAVTYPQQRVDDFWNWNGQIQEPLWGTPTSYQNETTRQQALYGTTRLAVSDRLKVLLGGRVSNYHYAAPNWSIETRQSGNFVPYAGVVYDLGNDISYYASYTSIFKPQDYREASGRLLDPLEGKSYETGLKGEFLGGKLHASAAYFQIRQDNYAQQIEDAYAPDGTPAYRALQGVVAKGFEFEASGELTRQLQLQGSFTHVIARLDGARVATISPENQFKLYTSYRADALLPGLKLGGGVRWQSRTHQAITNYALERQEDYSQSPYAVVDLMARYEISRELVAGLKINNVFDKAYRTNIGFYRTTSYGEPRNVQLSLTYRF